MEAGASSGWVGTDWVEDYTIRRLGPDRYDQWTDGALPFDSQPITDVFDELADLLRRPGAVDGGTRAVLTTPWERSANLLLEQPATCIMAHQADFLRREFPTGTPIGPDGDIDFFVLPAVDTTPPPLLLGGTLAVPLVGGHSVEAAMRLIASPELAEQLDQTSDFLSPHLDVDRQTVTDATSNRLLDLLAGTPEVRFDGSDLMPPAVGTGTFWTGMRTFFAGDDIGPVLADIQAGWPVTQSD